MLCPRHMLQQATVGRQQATAGSQRDTAGRQPDTAGRSNMGFNSYIPLNQAFLIAMKNLEPTLFLCQFYAVVHLCY